MKNIIALIREAECIGCTKCIEICPVDAILGAQQQMHTVIASECIGCKLCIAPCPVDCIDLITQPTVQSQQEKKLLAMRRFNARKERFVKKNIKENVAQTISLASKKNYITAAIARVKEKST